MTDFGERAGEELRSFQDRALSHSGPTDYSALVSGAMQVRGSRIRRRRIIGSGVIAACALLAVGAFLPQGGDDVAPVVAQAPAAFDLDGAGVAPELGQVIAAEGSTRALRFEGVEMLLTSGGQLKVLALGDAGSEVELIEGELRSAMTAEGGRKSTLVVGAHRIAATTAVIHVRFQPIGGKFALVVAGGVVDVSGPGITGLKRLKAGEELEYAEPAGEGAAVEDGAQEAARRDSGASQKDKASKATASADGWRNLAAEGKYGEAMAQVEKSGFDSTAGRLTVGDLVRLADVARMAGRTDRATDLLHRIRKTAAGTHHAATAAYSLGTTAFDQSGDFSGAARWFSRYLAEAPGGPLSREALGRMMEAQYRAGMTTAAQDTARKYEKAFPTGPHRSLAKNLISGER